MAGAHEITADTALDALHHRAGVGRYDRGLLRIALVSAAPAIILHDGDGRREAPVDAGRRRLRRGCRADAADEVGVARGAERDVVRKQRRANDVVGAVHRVGAPDDGHDRATVAALHRRVVEGIEQFQPLGCGRELVIVGGRVAAIQDRAELVRLQILRRDRGDVDLDQLPDLVLDAHPAEHRVDARLDLGIALALHRQRGPLTRMCHRGRTNLTGILRRQRRTTGKQTRNHSQLHRPHSFLPDAPNCDALLFFQIN